MKMMMLVEEEASTASSPHALDIGLSVGPGFSVIGYISSD
jgi:hypothetical protein